VRLPKSQRIYARTEFLRRTTVCSLGQPNQAIVPRLRRESQIEPWLASTPPRCFRGATTGGEREPMSPMRHAIGLREERTGAGRHRNPLPAKGKVFALDIPFHRTRPIHITEQYGQTRIRSIRNVHWESEPSRAGPSRTGPQVQNWLSRRTQTGNLQNPSA
jgi:hypothetical protein